MSLTQSPSRTSTNSQPHKDQPPDTTQPLKDDNSSVLSLILDSDDHSTFPEGGTEAYLVVFGSFCGLLSVFGLFNTVGVVQAYISEHVLVDESTTSISWIFSVFFMFSFGGGLYAGALFDYKGAKIPMTIGGVCFFLGMMLTAECTEVYQFVLTLGVLVGIGVSFLMNSCIASVSHFFLRKRGRAMGTVSIAGSLGGTIWPLMLRDLFPKIGFKWTMRVYAFISLVLLTLAWCFVKNRITKKMDPDAKRIDVIKGSFVLRELVTDKVYLSMSISLLFAEFSLIFILTYMGSYITHQGYSESDAFLVILVLNAAGAPGRYIPNWIADRYGNLNVMVISMVMCCVMIFVIWLPFGHKLSSMYAFAVLYGFFSSSIMSLAPVCCGQICKTEDFGKKYGTAYLLVALGDLGAVPAAGAIIDDGGGYNRFVAVTGALVAVSTMFWALTRYLLAGIKIEKV